MRKSKGRSRLIETLLKINDLIILDLVIDNFDEHFLNNSFDIDKTLNLDYDRKVIHIYRNIVSGNFKYLETLINYNNEYVKTNGYNKLDNEKLQTFFEKDMVRSIAGYGISAEQMILYTLTTGERKEDLEFFKKEYIEDMEVNYKQLEKNTLEKEPRLSELLQGTQFEKEFKLFVNNNYVGYDSFDFEKLGKKYNLEYNSYNGTYTVPSGFLVFFDNKTLEIFNKLELFQLNFGLLHGNLLRVNKYIEFYGEEEKKNQKIRKENKELKEKTDLLENKNKFLNEKIEALEDKEQNRLINEQQKEINYLYGQIEKLQQQLKDIEQDEESEIIENLEISEELKEEKQKLNLKGKNILIVGGNWNSKTKEEANQWAFENESNLEFIDAERIFRNSDKIKNADLVIFDTSRNSHSGYYKVKSLNSDIIHIHKSNLDKIKESL